MRLNTLTPFGRKYVEAKAAKIEADAKTKDAESKLEAFGKENYNAANFKDLAQFYATNREQFDADLKVLGLDKASLQKSIADQSAFEPIEAEHKQRMSAAGEIISHYHAQPLNLLPQSEAVTRALEMAEDVSLYGANPHEAASMGLSDVIPVEDKVRQELALQGAGRVLDPNEQYRARRAAEAQMTAGESDTWLRANVPEPGQAVTTIIGPDGHAVEVDHDLERELSRMRGEIAAK